MKLFKNIAEWFAILLIIFLSLVGASANNEKPKIETKYEIKSDILNFDYSKIGYPYGDAKIGTYFSIKDSVSTPRKLVQNKESTNNIYSTSDAFLYGFFFSLCIFVFCGVVLLIIMIIGHVLFE